MNQPYLIVVTGRPGAGKTTLAHALARSIRCPLLSRDEFKEGYLNTTAGQHDVRDREAIARVNETFFAAIELLVHNGVTLVAEAAFQHALWVPKLEPLAEISRLRLIVCDVGAAAARSRFAARRAADPQRVRFHGDDLRTVESLIAHYEPPRLSVPTLKVDSSDDYRPRIEQIVSFALQTQCE